MNYGEIKINREDVFMAIQELGEVKENLIKTYQKIADQNAELAMKWEGDSGDDFVQAALMVELRYTNAFNELEHQIQNLQDIWNGMEAEDGAMATGIESAMTGGK